MYRVTGIICALCLERSKSPAIGYYNAVVPVFNDGQFYGPVMGANFYRFSMCAQCEDGKYYYRDRYRCDVLYM